MTYMASCEGTTCDQYDATNAQWFKVDEAGQNANGSGWVQQEISQYLLYKWYRVVVLMHMRSSNSEWRGIFVQPP